MNAQTIQHKLEDTLKQMTALATQLAQIIAYEGKALKDADIDTLNKKVQDKQQCANTLASLDQQCRQSLVQLGMLPTQDPSEYLESIDRQNVLTALWETYLDSLRECDRRNRENSALINVGIRHTRRTLDFLLSSVGESMEPVYGPHASNYAENNHSFAAKA